MKRLSKIIVLLVITIMILLQTGTPSFARVDIGGGGGAPSNTSSSSGSSSGSGSGSGSGTSTSPSQIDIFGTGKEFINKGQLEEKINSSQAESDLSFVANILFSAGFLTLVITGMIMGVKYMISGADERANMKQRLVWWVIAAVLIFGTISIYNIVANVFIKSGI